MANKRNLAKPLVGRTLSFALRFGFLRSPALDVVGDWDPGLVKILREYYHEHNRPVMKAKDKNKYSSEIRCVFFKVTHAMETPQC